MKRVIVCFLACAGVAVMLSACGDNGKTDSGKKSAIKETAEGADKTADYLIGKKALEAGIESVVFDRGGYIYHGKVKALAEAAREAGLKF